MDEVPVAWNSVLNRLTCAVARDMLVQIINTIGMKVSPDCWKLTGDDPDSLFKFLGVSKEDMHAILRLCGIFGGDELKMKFKKREFERFADTFDKGCIDWSEHRRPRQTKALVYLKIGTMDGTMECSNMISLKPKDQYDRDGLCLFPQVQKHMLSQNKPKFVRQQLLALVEAVKVVPPQEVVNVAIDSRDKMPTNIYRADTSPSNRLLEFLVKEVEAVGKESNQNKDTGYKVTARMHRRLKLTVIKLVKAAATDLLEKTIARLDADPGAFGNKIGKEQATANERDSPA